MKRKVNLNRPQISSEEILSRKNFDSVLKGQVKLTGKPLLKKPWFLSSVIAVTVAIVATVVLLNKNANTTPNPESQKEVVTTVADSLKLEAFYASEEAKCAISPPIKGLDVPYTTYKLIAEKGANLDFKTGSKLSVPKNAFADENGKLIKGEVELRYREFHDPVDFFVSGIPMTYDSAGVKYQFESAGMMQMEAFQNGKKINMAPQKSIDVELASNYKGSEYNLYKLDTVKNNWACLGKDKAVLEVTKQGNTDVDFKPKDDQEEIAKVKQTPEYKNIETKKVELQKTQKVEIAALPKPLAEPKKPEQVKKGKFLESFEVAYSDFPELSAFKDVLWQVGDENKNFDDAKQQYITKAIVWESAIIKEGPKKGENYIITLTKGSKLKEDIIVYPVFEGENYKTAMKNYQEKFGQYKVVLDKRIASEKKIEEDYQAQMAAYNKRLEAMVDNIATVRQKEVEQQFKQGSTQEKVFRVFTVSSFGVFNSDNPSLYPQGARCTVTLKSEQNKSLKCYDVYLVDKKRNALFAYYKNPVMSFTYNPESKNMLWTVEDGVLYWFKPEQFNSIAVSNGSKNLIMNRVDQKFTTADELKTYFNF
jgi:hypothetical protein